MIWWKTQDTKKPESWWRCVCRWSLWPTCVHSLSHNCWVRSTTGRRVPNGGLCVGVLTNFLNESFLHRRHSTDHVEVFILTHRCHSVFDFFANVDVILITQSLAHRTLPQVRCQPLLVGHAEQRGPRGQPASRAALLRGMSDGVGLILMLTARGALGAAQMESPPLQRRPCDPCLVFIPEIVLCSPIWNVSQRATGPRRQSATLYICVSRSQVRPRVLSTE